MAMAKKQVTARIDGVLADELVEFCRRGRLVQEGVVEAAIYWLVRRMPRDEYLEVMDKAAAYLDPAATAGRGEVAKQAVDPGPEPERLRQAGQRAPRKRTGSRSGGKSAAG